MGVSLPIVPEILQMWLFKGARMAGLGQPSAYRWCWLVPAWVDSIDPDRAMEEP